MTLLGLFEYLRGQGLKQWAQDLQHDSDRWLVTHGDYSRWSNALAALPEISDIEVHLDCAAVGVSGNCADLEQLRDALRGLMPWRKGPYQLGEVFIDSEWRSDYKWQRLLPYLAPLAGRRILDVGCGNGYHCWRMLAEAPEFVLGVDPSVLFNLQFQAMQKYLRQDRIHLLPIGLENLPGDLNWFDTVFSMGVLYHRRSPLDHLYQLKSFLVDGGELCLETLVIPGESGRVLLPKERYARMRNVWFIPTAAELRIWLQRCGFVDTRVVAENRTGLEEQRSTEWMPFESLEQCLDAEDFALTVEGLPAPRRAIILANKP